MRTVTAVTGVELGPSPLDDDDLRRDIIERGLRAVFGDNPKVTVTARDIDNRLRQYELYKLERAS